MDYQKLLETTEKVLILRGGRGSGNWGHAGRKGKRGGSGKGGGLRAIGAKPGSSHEERQKASKKTKVKRQKKEAKERLLKDIGGLEDFSRDELLTLRSRIDNLLGGSTDANNRLANEKPGNTHGHTVTVLGTDPSKKFEMRYEVRELDDLITSNTDTGSVNPNYPKELQPRDRTRVASQRQIDNIASKLQPEALLDEFKAIDRGTPIIGGDNVVESGNGRSMALRRARDQHPEQFKKYQDELRKQAQDKGIDPATLEQFNNPVLVRKRVTKVDRVEFAKEANTASILGASDTERARSDASRISSEHLQNLSMRDSIDDTIRAPANRDFVRSFVANTPEVERATMVDRKGALTKSGENRIKGAMFNRVYDSPELSDRIFESTDNDIKNVTNGIMNSLGSMSRAEELVRTGQRNEGLSIAPDIAKMVQVYSGLKDRKMSVQDFLAQGALFGRELNPTQEKILVEIDKRRRSGKKLSEFFGGWSKLIESEPHPQQAGLFGPTGRSKDDLVDDWIKRAEQGPQMGLFQTAANIIILRGGATSGNWGHLGRKGKRGGSRRGGGHSAVGVKPGAGRKEIVSASKKERQARKEGFVTVSPKKLFEAQAAVAKAKKERDRDLKNVLAVDMGIQKASIANEKASAAFSRADAKVLKSLDASNKHLEKINRIAEKEIEAGRLSPWAMRETSEVLKPLLEKQEKLDQKDRENLEKANQANRKLVESAKKLNDAVEKKNTLPQGRRFVDEVMTIHQDNTEAASKVIFQHNLNEAKRVRAEMKNTERIRKKDLDRLNERRLKLEDVEVDFFVRMGKSDFPDNDPRAIKMMDQSFEVSGKIAKINREIRALKKSEATQAKALLEVTTPTKITTAPGSQRDPQIIEKRGWKRGREGFESLVSDDVVPSGTLTRFRRTKEDRSYHVGGGCLGGRYV